MKPPLPDPYSVIIDENTRLRQQNDSLFSALRHTMGLPGACSARALVSVLDERKRQNEKWGEQNHEPCVWSAILTEECGEFAEAALALTTGGANTTRDLREEAVHCAAVAVQIIEAIDRQGRPVPREVLPRQLDAGFFDKLTTPKEAA